MRLACLQRRSLSAMFWAVVAFLMLMAPRVADAALPAIESIEVGDETVDVRAFPAIQVTDRSMTLSAEELDNAPDRRLRHDGRVAAGVDNAVQWLEFSLYNGSDLPVSRVISVDDWYHERVDLYTLTSTEWSVQQAGLSTGRDTKSGRTHLASFDVFLLPGETVSYRLAVWSQITLWSSGVRVQDPATYDNTSLHTQLALSLYFGALAALIAYNGFLFFLLRERIYFYYVAYAVAFLVYGTQYTGFAAFWVKHSPDVSVSLGGASVGLFSAFSVLFSRQLLSIPRHFPRLDRVLQLSVWVLMAAAVLSFVSSASMVVVKAFLPLTAVLLYVGIVGWRRRWPYAKVYTLFYGTFLTGLTLHALLNFDLVPANVISRWGYLYGTLIELIGLSALLAYRIRSLQQQRENQHALLVQQQTEQQRLGEQVQERTEQLAVAVEQANKAAAVRASFLANMSHEIRTPLNAVLGLAYLAERETRESGTRQTLAKISRAGRSLLNLINDVLDLSKIEEGQLKIEHAAFDLQHVVDNIATIMAAAAQDKPIEVLVLPLPDDNLNLTGDAFRLEQILINLVGNAVKFTDTGFVELSIVQELRTAEKIRLRFAVRDSGIGISPDAAQKLFQPFSQADASTSRRFGGTGLGLSISKQLVDLMGGRIGLDSEPGAGSTFWFTVEFGVLPPVESVEDNPRVGKMVLSMEASKSRDCLQHLGLQLGWQVVAVSAQELSQQTAEGHDHHLSDAADIVVIDRRTPESAVARDVRQLRLRWGESCRVIALGLVAQAPELTASAASEAIDALVFAPVTRSGLRAALARALGADRRSDKASGAQTWSATALKGMRVLVVDDNEVNRELARRILASHGASLMTLGSGEDAVNVLKQNRKVCDVILMDIQMPGMDGMIATSLIRRLDGCEVLPIVALTAGAFPEQRDAALAAGMNAVVTKPFDVNELVTLLQRLMQREESAIRDPHSSAAVLPPSPSPGAAASPQSNRPLPAIDVEKGLALWEEQDQYRHFLRRFLQENPARDAAFMALSSQQQLTRAHKLRGSATALALPALAGIASELEADLHTGEVTPDRLASFLSELERTRGAINDYLNS